MDYIEIYNLSGDISDIKKKLIGYIGKDGDKIVVKNLIENIDLNIFDKPIEKRSAEDDGEIIKEISITLEQDNEEWLEYLGENLELPDIETDIELMASDIKTADKLP